MTTLGGTEDDTIITWEPLECNGVDLSLSEAWSLGFAIVSRENPSPL